MFLPSKFLDYLIFSLCNNIKQFETIIFLWLANLHSSNHKGWPGLTLIRFKNILQCWKDSKTSFGKTWFYGRIIEEIYRTWIAGEKLHITNKKAISVKTQKSGRAIQLRWFDHQRTPWRPKWCGGLQCWLQIQGPGFESRVSHGPFQKV
jgi:hypothetical protein